MADEPEKCKEESGEIKIKKKRGPAKSVVKEFRTTVWNGITKKCESFSRTVKKGQDEEAIRQMVIDWRDSRKKEIKRLKAQKLLEEKEFVETDDTFDLTPFKLKMDFETGRVMGFIGSSGSGKTTLMKWIYHKIFEDEDFITILYAANFNAQIYKDFGKSVIRMQDFNERMPKIEKAIQKGTNMKYKFLNILDDQVSNSTKNSEMLKKMMTSFRNSHIYTMVAMQDKTLLSSINRGNMHRIFFLKLNSDEAVERIIKTYLNSFLGGRSIRMDEKIKKYRDLTADHKFIMLDTLTDEITVHASPVRG